MVKIWIDPGHGGRDPGAVGNGLLEKDLTLRLARKISYRLDKYMDTNVAMTRLEDRAATLMERVAMANSWRADFFLSLHINAGGGEGFESFIYKGLSDSSDTAKKQLTIHNEIIKATKWNDRGRKKADFYVLRETKMAAMLSESGFIDNKADASRLKLDSFLDKIADGHVNGLVQVFNLVKRPIPTTTPSQLHYVQVGAFAERANAENMVGKLKAAGFPAYIK